MARYSPTSTKRYEECQIKFILEAEGWTPRVLTRRDLAPIIGSAFAAATARLHRELQRVPKTPIPAEVVSQACEIAERVVHNELERLTAADVELPDVESIDSELARIRRVITRYAKETPVLTWDSIAAIEHTIPEWGNLRIDLAGVYHGQPIVADLKYKRYLVPGLIHSTETSYEYDWQFLSICRAWQRTLELPHPPITALILVVAEPTWHCRQTEFEYAEETLQRWDASAEQKWADMDALLTGKRIPAMATVHETKYGRCPFFDACFTYHLDDELMKTGYVQLQKGGTDAASGRVDQ
jgi:hypothetical protein